MRKLLAFLVVFLFLTVPAFADWRSSFRGQADTQTTNTISGEDGITEPAGADTYVQFNDGGILGADSAFYFNKTTDVLTVTGGISTGTSTDPTIIFDPTTTGDNPFWLGLISDNGGTTASDYVQLGTGSVSGTTPFLQTDAAGVVSLLGAAGSLAPALRFYETASNGSNYAGLKAPAAMAGNVTWTLPSADSTGSQCLASNGSGELSWSACSGGEGVGVPGGSDTQVQYNDGDAFSGEAAFAYNKTTDVLSINAIDWTGGNVTYVDITDDIGDAVTAATSGDVLVLAAGTYTECDINITGKSVSIIGQGPQATIIDCSTGTAQDVVEISGQSTANVVRIKGIRFIGNRVNSVIDVEQTAGAALTYSNLYFENLEMETTSNATLVNLNGIYLHDAGATVRDVKMRVVGSGEQAAFGVFHEIENSAEAVTETHIYNADVYTYSNATNASFKFSRPFDLFLQDTDTPFDGVMRVYNSRFKAEGTSTSPQACYVNSFSSEAGVNAELYLNNVVCDGGTVADFRDASDFGGVANVYLNNVSFANGSVELNAAATAVSFTIGRDAFGHPGVFIPQSELTTTNSDQNIEYIINNVVPAGGWVFLPAYEFTTDSDIDITKSVHIRGAGQAGCATSILTATNTINVFDITADDVSIADLCISVSANSRAIQFDGTGGGVFTNSAVENVTINKTDGSATTASGITLKDAGGIIRNVNINAVFTAGDGSAIYAVHAATAEAPYSVNIYDSYFSCNANGAGTNIYCLRLNDSSSTSDVTLNVYNSRVVATETAGSSNNGTICQNGDSFCNFYNSYIDGVDNDVFENSSGGFTLSNTVLADNQITGTITSVTGALKTEEITTEVPAAQTIAATNTITANACGGLKLITADGAVTTNTTNTFSAPAIANEGCIMHVCNSGAQNITLDNNAKFVSAGGADVVMTANDCVTVASTGTGGVWYQISALEAN